MGLRALKQADTLCCFLYKGVLEGGVRSFRQPLDQPRRLDPMTPCTRLEGDKMEQKKRTRPDSSR